MYAIVTRSLVLVVVLAVTQARGDEQTTTTTTTTKTSNASDSTLDWATPVLNAVMCPLTKDPWGCGREQAVRMIDVAIADVEQTKQAIKDEADADLADRIARRAFSESELPVKEKPSAVMTTLDNYITNSILSFMGRTNTNTIDATDRKKKPQQHNHHHQSSKPSSGAHQQDVHVHVHNDKPHEDEHHHHTHQTHHAQHAQHVEHDDEDDDDDDEPADELQMFEGHHDVGGHHGGLGGHRKPHHGGFAGHKKPIHHKYGRDLGVTRGKKHKKKFKKALVKLLVLAAVAKVKLEFFLKVLGTHLQVKFFIIALLGLLLNAAKFWLDLKKGHSPQKVIYYEHAQHQHHYDDHADDGWGGGGGYWKRSFDSEDSVDADTDSDPAAFEERAAMQAYRQSRSALPATRGSTLVQQQQQQQQQQLEAQKLAYSRQRPTANV